jgi:hypothetical protein
LQRRRRQNARRKHGRASNTGPREVYSDVEITSPKPFRFDFVRGSGRMYSNAHPGCIKLSDSVIESGALLGYEAPDGVIEPGYRYSLLVTYQVRITQLGA